MGLFTKLNCCCNSRKRESTRDATVDCCELFAVVYYVLLFLADMGSNSYVVWIHYENGKMLYFGLTLGFLLVPCIIVMSVSLWSYHVDLKSGFYEHSLGTKICVIAVHLLQLAPLLRYIEYLRLGIMSRKMEKAGNEAEAKKFSRGKVAGWKVIATLSLLKVFLKDAPQVLLQMYIMAQPGEKLRWMQYAYCSSSLHSMGRATASYDHSARRANDESTIITCKSTYVQFTWFQLTIYARIAALGLFLPIHPRTLLVVLSVRWLITVIWLNWLRIKSNGVKCRDILVSILNGGILIFTDIGIGERPRRWISLCYYVITFMENAALISVWYASVDPHLSYRLPIFVSVFTSFALGICAMVAYYVYFHPNGKMKFQRISRFRWRWGYDKDFPENVKELEGTGNVNFDEDISPSNSVDIHRGIEGTPDTSNNPAESQGEVEQECGGEVPRT